MSQTPTPATPAPFAWDDNKITEKVKDLESYYKPFSGKAGYNPHFFLTKMNNMIAASQQPNGKTKELYDAILGLQKTEPVAPGCSPIVKVK